MQQMSTSSRPDPAPSRWAYRLERLLLTPLYRQLLRIGLPFALCFAAVSYYFSDPDRQLAVASALLEIREQIEKRPEFMVNHLAVTGASEQTERDIRALLAYDLPLSSFDLDLVEARETIESLAPVAEASLRIRQGGVLTARITEREPVALWRTRGGLAVVDIDGVVIGTVAHRGERAELPILAGKGADGRLPEALDIFRASKPLSERVVGLVRVGERRWDMVLDRDQRILLPERGAVRALERVILLAQVQDMLDRDLALVDMRLPQRPTIRMTEAAQEEWWRIRRLSAEASEQ